MKAKLPLIVLLILLIISGIITIQFYSDKQNLLDKNQSLEKAKATLTEKNNLLQSKYKSLEKMYTSSKERLNDIQQELSRVSQEKEDLKNRYKAIYKEKGQLVLKLREMAQAKSAPVVINKKKSTAGVLGAPVYSEQYWSDVVRKKAELEAKLEGMQKEMLDTKTELSRLQKKNKELSLKIDEITQEKDRIEKEASFKEKTMEIMSRDLVNEREARNNLTNEIKKLRDENMDLKRELIVANRDKIKLQGILKDTLNKKNKLEKKMEGIKSLLKDKKMMFLELENQLTKAVGGETKTDKTSASVELPPIVVRPDTSSKSLTGKTLKGEVLAVNKNDNFVIIDLGDNSGVKPGLKFNILRSGKTIGSVDVIETRKEISAADIEEVSPGYTIREGDTVIEK